MKVTGQILKENREKQGLTVNEVALMIKVNTKTVLSIEEGDLSSLPAKTFLRGFVRSYAKLLKLDVNDIMNTFYDEMGSTKPNIAIRDQKNEEDRKKALEHSMEEETSPLLKKLIWSGAGVVALVLIIFVLRQVEKYEQESLTTPIAEVQKEITPISSNVEEKEKEETPAEDKATSTETTATEKKEDEKKENEELKQVEAKKPEEKKEEKAEEKTEVAKKAEKKEEPKKKAVVKNQEVILEAFDKITVKYSTKSGKNTTLNLKEDEVKVIKASGAIKLSISDGGSVNLVHNGKDLGVPGSLGSPLDITLQ